MWNDIIAVIRKEICHVMSYKFTLLLAVGVTFYTGIVFPWQMMGTQQRFIGGPQMMVNLYAAFFFTATGLIMSWGLITLTFLMEKIEGTLETLLTTPLSLFGIWAGKTFAIATFGVLAALICFLSIVYKASTENGYLVLPSPTGWLFLALAPFSIFVLVGLNGLLQMIIPQPGIGKIAPFGFAYVLFRMGVHFHNTLTLSFLRTYVGVLGITTLLVIAGFRFLTREQLVLF